MSLTLKQSLVLAGLASAAGVCWCWYQLVHVDRDYEKFYENARKKPRKLLHNKYSYAKLVAKNDNGDDDDEEEEEEEEEQKTNGHSSGQQNGHKDKRIVFDVIVIGGGLSGLSCAATLSRVYGKKVLVLEKHETVVGGGTHQFEVGGNGFSYSFDSGLHYAIPECQLLLQLCAGVSQPPVVWDRLGEADGTFEHVILGYENSADDDTINGHANGNGASKQQKKERKMAKPFGIKHYEAHVPELYRQYPEFRKEIDAYMAAAEEVLKSFPFYLLSKFFPRSWQDWAGRNLLGSFRRTAGVDSQTVLDRVIPQTTARANQLKALLCGLWIDTGSRPDKASFMMQASVFRGLPIQGGAYPRGGSQQMSLALVPAVLYNGGKVFIHAPVDQIIVDGQRAVGVRLADGTEVYAQTVVSSVGYNNTYGKLVPKAAAEALKIPRNMDETFGLSQSDGFIMANIGIRGDPAELGLSVANWWYHPIDAAKNNNDLFQCCRDLYDGVAPHDRPGAEERADEDEIDFPAMITFPSLKDREWVEKHPGHIGCQVLMLAPYGWFDRDGWSEQGTGKRAAEYQRVKEYWGRRCEKFLTSVFPKVAGHIDVVNVSTPLSIESYLGSWRGGAVGLDLLPKRFADEKVHNCLDIQSPIKGLFLTGQDVVLCGQPLVQVSGIATAVRAIGTGYSTYTGHALKTIFQWWYYGGK